MRLTPGATVLGWRGRLGVARMVWGRLPDAIKDSLRLKIFIGIKSGQFSVFLTLLVDASDATRNTAMKSAVTKVPKYHQTPSMWGEFSERSAD